MPDLWNKRRLPYFFRLPTREGDWVLCPQCALEHAGGVRPVFHVSCSVMCRRCSILIGPINEKEMNDD